jgi:hypothetical protein
MIDLKDAVAAVRLIKRFVQQMEHHQDLSFV